ncbi:MAG: aldehyde ferredoxin oxidoreductase family protein [Deltaproteobacteria bacterium]|nr:aldehyde ferredoxin oxidoreductase family protein [Deltaproteobacteria bacterium]
MHGLNGKTLRVNLTERRCTAEAWPEELYRRFLGGRGFIVHVLLRELEAGADPLGPENKLIFALGPLTGHHVVGSGRHSVGAKSPLTGAFLEGEAGGYWGAELKKAGFDFVVIEGRSDDPVYLWIHDGVGEIRPASHLWGLEPAQTQTAVRAELGDGLVRLAVIGPGGEKLVRYSCIAHDLTHIAGRGGLGAVMGSKKLKAVAVRGSARPQPADPEKIKELTRFMGANFRNKPGTWSCGTGKAMIQYEQSGNIPVRNFQGGSFPGAANLAPQRLFELEYVKRMEGCFGCPLKCKRIASAAGSYTVDPAYGGPEYETLTALGVNCGIDQVEPLIKANELCNRFGIDTISTGVVISFAMECFERGLLGPADTDGLELRFGRVEAMLTLVDKIGRREGLGDLLAEGSKIAAEKIGGGAIEYAMQVKGMEIPMHEPRLKQGMALHYAVNPAGPDHCSGIHDDLVAKNLTGWDELDVAHPLPPTETSPAKARMLYQVGLWRHLGNILGLCLFVPWSRKQIVEAVQAVTGWPMSYWRLMKTVERGITLGRLFHLREGFTSEQDRLPSRFHTAPTEGPLAGVAIDRAAFHRSREAYYQMLGWDTDGVPTLGRLIELDLAEYADVLPGLDRSGRA